MTENPLAVFGKSVLHYLYKSRREEILSRLLHLSEAVSLALHAAALIAAHPGEPVSVKRIAGEAAASVNHLAKIMQRLVRGGILSSYRGPKGGFTLAVPAESLSLLDIYEAIEGSPPASVCPARRPSCPFRTCMFDGLLERLDRDVVLFLAEKRLSEYAPRGAGETI